MTYPLVEINVRLFNNNNNNNNNNNKLKEQVCWMSNPGKCRLLKKKTMRTWNKNSTPQLAVYVTKMQQISIYLAGNVTLKYFIDACSYRHTNFTILLDRKANTHVLIARQQA